jgi:hypothetical protein
MPSILFSNNASGSLASSITSAGTTITLTTGAGAQFPAISGGNFFYATLTDSSNNLEIVKVTARSSDVFTVVRGQEGTTARAYAAADKLELRVTAAVLNTFAQTAANQTFSGANNFSVAPTLGTPLAVTSGGTGVATSTGSGNVVLSNSPTLVTPALGTPSALVGTNITGTASGLSIGGNAATASAPASGGSFITSSNIGSQSVNYANSAGNGGVTSVNGSTGAVTVTSIGVGQTWQNVTGSRSSGTSYTNSTGKPILVNAFSSRTDSGFQLTAVCDGVTVGYQGGGGGGDARRAGFVSFIVPAGSSYTVTYSGGADGSTLQWAELR